MENEKVFELMTKMYSEMQEGFKRVDDQFKKVDDQFKKVDERLEKLESKVDKNTMLLEKTNHNVKLLAEGHENIVEQMNIKFEELEDTISANYSLHDKAIKELAKSSAKGEEAYKYIQKIKQSLTD